MLIEAYGKGGLVPWLVETYPLDFLESLLNQTLEFRRDPEERERELSQEQARIWREENQGNSFVFVGENGEKEIVSLADFGWDED
ncbi:MAG: hypothetical protein HC815_19415 [Richelia sp. RM1_1_1]|nr:hypothetical protein [Richelia sp. RM1_1_1]